MFNMFKRLFSRERQCPKCGFVGNSRQFKRITMTTNYMYGSDGSNGSAGSNGSSGAPPLPPPPPAAAFGRRPPARRRVDSS